jgi:tRNA(Ile)-lysidine synthase
LNQCGLDPKKPVLVGVSGGADSLCLLGILKETGYRLIVAHFDHQLRPEAALEAAAVSEQARMLGLPFVSDCADVQAYAKEQSLSLEEAARMLRYRFLFSAARKQAAQAVAVGHTADDQVETVLMHFLRGAGLSGLKGMEYRTFLLAFDPLIPLVRPLLSLWRADTESYCREHGIQPHFDTSNADTVYFRNRLRHELIPELEKYNPRFKETLLRTSQALQGDYMALQEGLETAWKDIVVERRDAWVVFDQSGLTKLPRGLQRNLFRRAAEGLRPEDRDIGFDALERAAAFARTPMGNLIDFVNGLYLFAEKGKIYLAAYEADLPFSQWPQVSQPIAISRSISPAPQKDVGDRQLDLGNDWVLTKEETPQNPEEVPLSSDNWSIWLDADLLPADHLVVRPRRAGDIFIPLGMDGQTVKVKDFYINLKIPRRARAHWPLVCAGEQVLWVVGYRIAHPFRITEKTKHILHLEIKKLPKP